MFCIKDLCNKDLGQTVINKLHSPSWYFFKTLKMYQMLYRLLEKATEIITDECILLSWITKVGVYYISLVQIARCYELKSS